MLKPVENRRYGFVLVVQVFLFFMAPFMRGHPLLFLLFVIGLFGIFGTVILTIWTARLPRLLAMVCAVVALATGYLALPSLRYEEAVVPYLTVCAAAYALFILVAIVSIGADVLIRERITLDCILGSICVYLFLGMFFAFIFGLCALLIPEAFHSMPGWGSSGAVTLNDILYFSYSTLTTVGYGDITPAHPFVRTLASFEGVTGTLYIAVMITRLVSLHVAHGGRAGEVSGVRPPPPDRSRP
jgi:voltage-gated potassium channel Kch